MAINRFGLHCFISSARSHRQFIIDDIHIKSLVKYTHTIKPYDFLIFAVPVTLINVQSMIQGHPGQSVLTSNQYLDKF